jgi:UDP-N-acetylglucosamine:LPS N-acetylglucosamine transferase
MSAPSPSATTVARTPDAEASGLRVLLVSAGMGAGHTSVATELSRRLRRRGADTNVLDVVEAAGPAGARLRTTYRLLLGHAGWVYDGAMRFWARHPRPLEWLTAANAGPFERAIEDAAARFRPDLIVSTYNLAGQCLGRLLERGRVDVPVVTLVVDPGAHPYWVSRRVDLHLAVTASAAAQLERYGARRVATVAPVLRPEFADPSPRADARRRLALPEQALVAVLTSGSWAVGGIEATLDVIRHAADVCPVVLCGRDTELQRRVAAVDGVRSVGWTNAVADYLAAADVVVDNAGGQTCWEALACRTPVLLFRPLPGHGMINAAALDTAGLATWVRGADRLVERMQCVSRGPRPARTPGAVGTDDAADHVLSLARV